MRDRGNACLSGRQAKPPRRKGLSLALPVPLFLLAKTITVCLFAVRKFER